MRRLTLLVLLVACLAVVPAAAQSPESVVVQVAVKTSLLGQGATTEERTQHAAQFTRTVACELHRLDAGWGLLEKTSGNNVNGYSVDCVVNRAGEVYDVVRASDAADAAPQWLLADHVDPARWRPPLEADCLGSPPPPDPPPPTVDLTAIVARLDAILARLDLLMAQSQAQDAAQTVALKDAIAQLKAEVAKGIRIRFY
jgi:hypothetical protein